LFNATAAHAESFVVYGKQKNIDLNIQINLQAEIIQIAEEKCSEFYTKIAKKFAPTTWSVPRRSPIQVLTPIKVA
jgi:hypothetical protein